MAVLQVNPLGIPLLISIPQGALTVAANTILALFVKGTEKKLARLYIHNLAATAVKVAINSAKTAGTADASDGGVNITNAFNDILAGGNSQDDGIGSSLTIDCKDLSVENVIVYHDTNAVRIAVTKYYDPYYS